MTKLLPTALLSLFLLSACTGTTEDSLTVRFAVLSSSGDTTLISSADVGSTTPSPAPLNPKGAVDIEALPGGKQLALLYRDRLEVLSSALTNAEVLPVPSGLNPCFVKLSASVARDRLAALSDCGGGALQNVVVWRSDGTLSFSFQLPPPSPSTPDQTHMAVQGDTVWLVHPSTNALVSDLIQTSRNSDGTSTQALPITLATPVYDLAFYKGNLYAATNNGAQVLTANGALTAIPGNVFSTRVDRLYSDDRWLAAWRADSTSQPLQVWNGVKVGSPNSFSDLRDVTFAPDGTLGALSSTALTTYDAVSGLDNSNWRAASRLSVNDARAVTWLIP